MESFDKKRKINEDIKTGAGEGNRRKPLITCCQITLLRSAYVTDCVIIEDHYRVNQGPGLSLPTKGRNLDVSDFCS